MNFVLDNSVSMRRLFGDGKPQDADYARNVLVAMAEVSAIAPVTWGLEVANVVAGVESKA